MVDAETKEEGYNENYIDSMKRIREDILEDDIKELSYSINPKYRGNGYGKLMMFLFLFDKKGKFQCEVKTTNIGSVKMCEWSGFNLIKTINEVNIYQLIK